MKNKGCHIYCLQDTHFTDEDVRNIIDQWGDSNFVFSNYKTSARGVAILFGKTLDYKINRKIVYSNGNYIILDIKINDRKVTLVNLYGPNNDSPNFFKQISNCIDDIDNDETIICGDFNCVLNPELDYYNYKSINNPKAREIVLELMNTKYLVDPYREKNPTKNNLLEKKRNPCKPARLDYFLISETLMQHTKSVVIDSSYRSDHRIVILALNLTNFKHGKSFWKHNNSLLLDSTYLEKINKKI